MVTHRILDKDSVSVDNQHHLAAISSFGRKAILLQMSRDVGTEFLYQSEVVVPILSNYLSGNQDEEGISLLREHLPKVRDALRVMLGDLGEAHKRGVGEALGEMFLEWLVVGTHIEATLFALFPERWSAMNLGVGSWGDADVLGNNVYWTREGLQGAESLCKLWREVLSKVSDG